MLREGRTVTLCYLYPWKSHVLRYLRRTIGMLLLRVIVRIRRAEHSDRTGRRNVRSRKDSSSQFQNVCDALSVPRTTRPSGVTPSGGNRNVSNWCIAIDAFLCRNPVTMTQTCSTRVSTSSRVSYTTNNSWL